MLGKLVNKFPRNKKAFNNKLSFKAFCTQQRVDYDPSLKTNLIDTFGRFHNYLRISLTERCNLRCQVS